MRRGRQDGRDGEFSPSLPLHRCDRIVGLPSGLSMTQNNKFRVYNLLAGLLPERWRHLRVRILRICGVTCDDSVIVSAGARFYGEGHFTFGEHVIVRGDVRFESNTADGEIFLDKFSEINHGSYVSANDGSHVRIGAHCRVAHFVSLKTSSHEIDILGNCIGGTPKYRDITIADGSWLCAGVIVIPGVRIGEKNVVAAGAVVTKDTEDGVLMAGVPAVVKKRYLNDCQ